MSSPLGDPRYILYVKPSPEQLNDLDNSLKARIRSEIEKFQTTWSVEGFFEKSVSKDVDYIKRSRGDTRAFATYCNVDGVNILLVLSVFKQKEKNRYWQAKSKFQKRAVQYQNILSQKSKTGDITRYLKNLRDNNQYIVVGPDD